MPTLAVPRPARAPYAVYDQHFLAPVNFGAERTALTFPRADLELPIPTGDDQLHRWARDYLELRYLAPSTGRLAACVAR